MSLSGKNLQTDTWYDRIRVWNRKSPNLVRDRIVARARINGHEPYEGAFYRLLKKLLLQSPYLSRKMMKRSAAFLCISIIPEVINPSLNKKCSLSLYLLNKNTMCM